MEKIIFITNHIFIDKNKLEGGVSYCTKNFITLLRTKFDIIYFPLRYNKSILFRIKAKLGLDIFEDYNPADYQEELFRIISQNKAKKVFINLSSASAVSKVIKDRYNDEVKIILCSHGIEAGDFIHHSVRFKNLLPKLQGLTSSYKLGKILQNELLFRLNYFDLILTVSEIETAIEKWLGAKKTFFVPRVFSMSFIEWKPIIGRLGFVGDISHYPNYYGLLKLCEEIQNNNTGLEITIRVVGKPCSNLTLITDQFPFVQSLGYLDNDKLIFEAGTWMYYLNLVFYYSKGVSTKLEKGMNWGLPVISTNEGNRGYLFFKGAVNTISNVNEIPPLIKSRVENTELLRFDKKNIEKAVETSDTYIDIMNSLYPVLQSL